MVLQNCPDILIARRTRSFMINREKRKGNGIQGRGTMLSALNFDWNAHCLPFNYLFNADRRLFRSSFVRTCSVCVSYVCTNSRLPI